MARFFLGYDVAIAELLGCAADRALSDSDPSIAEGLVQFDGVLDPQQPGPPDRGRT